MDGLNDRIRDEILDELRQVPVAHLDEVDAATYAMFHVLRLQKLQQLSTWTSVEMARSIKALEEDDAWLCHPDAEGYSRHEFKRFLREVVCLDMSLSEISDFLYFLDRIVPLLDDVSSLPKTMLREAIPYFRVALRDTDQGAGRPPSQETREAAKRIYDEAVEEVGPDADQETIDKRVVEKVVDVIQTAPTHAEMHALLRGRDREPAVTLPAVVTQDGETYTVLFQDLSREQYRLLRIRLAGVMVTR